MENNEQTTSLQLAQNATARGGGGKLRKPSSRKPPTTPYARPQQQRGRWLSKLVDPACRLISGGATRIFPSLFSKSTECSLPIPENQEQEEYHDTLDTEVEEIAGDDGGLNHGECRSTGLSGPSSTAGRSKNSADFDGHKQDIRVRGDKTNGGLSEIEQLLKGKTFSRDEINRLIEIINSRAVAVPKQENKYLSLTVKENAERPVAPLENPRKLIEEKQEDLSKSLWATPTTHLQPSMQDEVGASPIEIAKAYMGIRTSDVGLGSTSILSKDERALLNGDGLASKPFITSPSPKPSTCWPGAMLQDQRGYLTPRSESGYGLHNFPRTPYSRTIFSKSKLQGDGNRGQKISSTPLQQSQTPIYEQSRRNALDSEHGSVGPIRRMRHKGVAESPARGSIHFHSSLNGPSPLGNSKTSEDSFPAVKKNLGLGGRSSSSIFQSVDRRSPSLGASVPPVHPHSSQMARTILEHLDRNPPTPRDKSAELKLAISWKNPPSSNVSTAMPSEHNTFLHIGGLDSSKKTDQGDKKNSAQVTESRVNTFFKVPVQENTTQCKDAVSENTSGLKVDGLIKIQGAGAGYTQDIRKNQAFDFRSKNENDSKTIPNAAGSEVLNILRKPPSNAVGTKPVLPSIFVGKPDQRWTFSSDNIGGFTFPISASSGVSSEPPTPSIMPSNAASDMHQSKEGSAVSSYSFGLNRSTTRLVFAFPFTSSAPTNGDTTDLKFNFGSDKSRRISFSSVGKDGICY